jgi:hypothetical protein
MGMRKKYNKPKLTVETMNLPLLLDTSNIHVGGTGSFDAKEFSSNYYDDFSPVVHDPSFQTNV